MNEQPEPTHPTPELSADLFVTTALQLAEQSGDIEKVSLRNLGKTLGVDPTAVYRYFPSKTVLVDAMMKRLVADFMPSDEEMAGDWRVRLTALLRRAYRVFVTYPSLTIKLPSSPHVRTPIVDQFTEIAYRALGEAGLSDEYIVLFHEILYTFALGMGQIDAQLEENLDEERRMMQNHVATISPTDFPDMHRLAHLIIADSEAIFQLVVEIYLNAIESYASGSPE